MLIDEYKECYQRLYQEFYIETMFYSLEELITILRSDMYYTSVANHYDQIQRDEAILYHQLKRGEY